jgi:hypothetical protein
MTKKVAQYAENGRNIDKPKSGSQMRGLLDKADRRIETTPIEQLIPSKANARTHSRKQVRQIAGSITRFGFCNPVLIDDANQIIAGHGRVEAAKLLGLEGVPTLRIAHLSEAEKRAYVLADNRLAELAGWDREILAIELQGLIDLEFDVELTGFEMGEIDIILDEADQGRRESAEADDDIPERVPGPPSSRIGDRGCSAPTACCVVMHATTALMNRCSTAARPSWFSRIRPTMCRSMATSAAWVRPSIANSRWLLGK